VLVSHEYVPGALYDYAWNYRIVNIIRFVIVIGGKWINITNIKINKS